ncbi:DUF3052 domain-containing protein [Longispora fulva]|uniref:DUF3052 family protein n=1 Tax=Longispora fulva TaxID=619741 RepID=A0A8J7KGZ7_9ACTN|nr:DUF3052 family protein [Longispora fulva]MBG6135409.1 hypothetical protein [Longispora fulva]GIG56348.1 DUF3052 domain-containing protein [Longispora fulva]
MAGYSDTPLPKKLGIAPGLAVAVLGGTVPGVEADDTLDAGPYDVIVLFVTSRADLEGRLAQVRAAMTPAAGFWVAWPKKASKVPTDMTEDVVRAVALPTGLVDNKVCAIDAVWSGLRLVIRR